PGDGNHWLLYELVAAVLFVEEAHAAKPEKLRHPVRDRSALDLLPEPRFVEVRYPVDDASKLRHSFFPSEKGTRMRIRVPLQVCYRVMLPWKVAAIASGTELNAVWAKSYERNRGDSSGKICEYTLRSSAVIRCRSRRNCRSARNCRRTRVISVCV